ncbi:hypothetical protein HDU93_007346 [Gonapodya sp. JEL0774]|nr:hypothetical protein HDU93_007346 [Gonapodya sp. JEL0774]
MDRPRLAGAHARSVSALDGSRISPSLTVEEGFSDLDITGSRGRGRALTRDDGHDFGPDGGSTSVWSMEQQGHQRQPSNYTLTTIHTILNPAPAPPPASFTTTHSPPVLTRVQRKYISHRRPVLDTRSLKTFGAFLGPWKDLAWPSRAWTSDALVVAWEQAWEWAEFALTGTVVPFETLEGLAGRTSEGRFNTHKAPRIPDEDKIKGGTLGAMSRDSSRRTSNSNLLGAQSSVDSSTFDRDLMSGESNERDGGIFALVTRALSRASVTKSARPTADEDDSDFDEDWEKDTSNRINSLTTDEGTIAAIKRVLSRKSSRRTVVDGNKSPHSEPERAEATGGTLGAFLRVLSRKGTGHSGSKPDKSEALDHESVTSKATMAPAGPSPSSPSESIVPSVTSSPLTVLPGQEDTPVENPLSPNLVPPDFPTGVSGAPKPPPVTDRLPVKLLLVELDLTLPWKELLGRIFQLNRLRDCVGPSTTAGVLLRSTFSNSKTDMRRILKTVKRIGKETGFTVPVLVEANVEGATAIERVTKANHFRKVVEMCRDELNGVLAVGLGGVVLEEDSIPRQRIRENNEKRVFESLIRLLSNEVTIRDSFLVVDITVIPSDITLPAALERHRVTWSKERGFLEWKATGTAFSRFEDIPRPGGPIADVDVFEWMAGDPAVLAVKDRMESTWREISRGEKGWWDKARERAIRASTTWRPPLEILGFEQALSTFATGGVDEARESVIVPPAPPSPPSLDDLVRLASDMRSDAFHKPPPENVFATHLRALHAHCTTLDEGTGVHLGKRVVECSFIGRVPCPKRRAEVARSVFGALENLQEKNLLATFKTVPDLESAPNGRELSSGYVRFLDVLGSIANGDGMLKILQDIDRTDALMPESSLGSDSIPTRFPFIPIVMAAAAQLRDELETESISIFLGSRASFRLHGNASEPELPYAPVWGVGGVSSKDDKTTHLYVCDAHPHPEEIIFNLYLQVRFNVESDSALIAECLVSGMLLERVNPIAVPSRLGLEIEISGPDDLVTLDILQGLRKRPSCIAGTGILAIGTLLQDYASTMAQYHLRDYKFFLSSAIDSARCSYTPNGPFEKDLLRMFDAFLLSSDGQAKVSSIVASINCLFDSQETREFGCLLFASLWKGYRYLVWDELKVSLRSKNGRRFLRDSDQAAVSLEMTTTQRNLNVVFGCTSLQLSGPMNDQLRADVGKARVSVDTGLSSTGAKDDLDQFSYLQEQAKDFVNAFVFVYPVLLDILLTSVIGSGIFYCDKISDQMKNHMSITLLVCFPIIGGLLNSIARTSTSFINTRSYPVFFEVLMQKFAMTFLVAGFVSAAVSIPFAVLWDWHEALLFPYALTFIWFMILFGTLLLLRDANRLFLLSEGPQAVAIATLILLIAPLVSVFALDATNSDVTFVAVYIGAFICADIFMLHRLAVIAQGFLEWPQRVEIPHEDDVRKIFAIECEQPASFENETALDYQKRLRLWERLAREYYAAEVEQALKSHKPFGGRVATRTQQEILERCENWRWERPLVLWYSGLSGLPLPSPFSSEWDTLARQAKTKLHGRYQANKPNRGDILFDMELPAIVFGALYFVFIFVDRWSALLANGITFIFTSTSNMVDASGSLDDSYLTGVRYGTLFILLGSGFLEMALLRLLSNEQAGKTTRLSKNVTTQDLLSISEQAAKNLFWKELFIFSGELLLVAIGVALIGFHSVFSSTSSTFSYFVSCFGFYGLLVALFAKLHIKREADLNVTLAVASIVGIAGSCAFQIVLKSPYYLFLIDAASSWLFAIVAFFLSGRDTVFRRRGFRISPLLNTSGFRRLGLQVDETLEAGNREQLLKVLVRRKKHFRVLPCPTSETTFRILSQFLRRNRFLDTQESGGDRDIIIDHIGRRAFPELSNWVSKAVDNFQAGLIVVYSVAEELSSRFQNRYHGISYLSPQTGKLEVFCVTPAHLQDLNQFLFEVVLHEYLETVIGLTHSQTVAATHLVLVEDSPASDLTTITKRDIEAMQRFDQKKLHLNAEVQFAKRFQFDNCPQFASPLMALPPMAIKAHLSHLSADDAMSIVNAHAALLVGLYAAVIVAGHRENERANPQAEVDSNMARSRASPNLAVLSLYLALTADPRFGREISNAKRVHIPESQRSLIYDTSAVVTRCDLFDFPNKNSISVKMDSDIAGFSLCMARFNGPRGTDWKPITGRDKPLSKAYFESKRLICEQIFHANDTLTILYDYQADSAHYPQRRFVLKGAFKKTWLEELNSLEQCEQWMETQHFINNSGRVRRSSIRIGSTHISATFTYPGGDSSNALLIADTAQYEPMGNDWSLTVHFARGWDSQGGMPKFSLLEYQQGETAHLVSFDYSHPQHVKLDCVQLLSDGSKRPTATPSIIATDQHGLLKRGPPIHFDSSSELLTTNLKPVNERRWLRIMKTDFYGCNYSTSRKREELWALWRANKIPGAIARTLDLDVLLREEKSLEEYFSQRDCGDLEGSAKSLSKVKDVLDMILTVPDTPETRPSSMHVRIADLQDLAAGGDSSQVSSNGRYWSSGLKVVAIDSGTFPTGGGGVGSCRRDLVNNLDTIRWTCLAELADSEVAQREYQLEKHVDALHYLPIWDQDFGNPNENFRRSVPAAELTQRLRYTSKKMLRETFAPLIQQLVHGIFDESLVDTKLEFYESTFVKIYELCQEYDWVTCWESNESIDAFIAAALQICNIQAQAETALAAELPTLHELGLAYSLLSRTLLPLSFRLPEFPNKCPCYHASHHGPQAIVGVLAKKLHGVTFVVWDHGVLWRERLFGLCDAENMPLLVQTVFAGMTRLIAWLAIRRADVITPCTSIQNPVWEAHLGGGKFNDNDARSSTMLKISPVVNGMSVARFHPKFTAELEQPTGVMLSHISPVKGVARAIAAVGVIVKEYGIRNFELHIYGSTEKDPAYTGSPAEVLPTGWVFVNSSITEGLPLALGEAGLCGLPVVCTDVGGSREVASDLVTGEVYGAIVPAGREHQLARAILSVLAVTDGLEDIAGEPRVPAAKISDFLSLGPEGAGMLEVRMKDPAIKAARQRVGLRLRQRVIQTFSIAKYLRVHEQIMSLGTAYAESHTRGLLQS